MQLGFSRSGVIPDWDELCGRGCAVPFLQRDSGRSGWAYGKRKRFVKGYGSFGFHIPFLNLWGEDRMLCGSLYEEVGKELLNNRRWKKCWNFGIIYLLLLYHNGVEFSLGFADRIVRKFAKGAWQSCWIELRSLEQSRAEQSRAEQSRAEQSRAWGNCALFASCDHEAFETEYNIRDG